MIGPLGLQHILLITTFFYVLWSLWKGLDIVKRLTMSQIMFPSCKEYWNDVLKWFSNSRLDVMSISVSTKENFRVASMWFVGRDWKDGWWRYLALYWGMNVYTLPWPSTPAHTVAPSWAKPWHSQPHSLPLIKTTGHFSFFFRPSPSYGLSGKSIMCIKSTCINSPPVGWARTPQERRQRLEPQLYRAEIHSDDLQARVPSSFSLSLSLWMRLRRGVLIVPPDLKCLWQSCWMTSWFRGSKLSGSWGCAKRERWGRNWDVSLWTVKGEEILQTDDCADRTCVND